MQSILVIHRPFPETLEGALAVGASKLLLDVTGPMTADDRTELTRLLRSRLPNTTQTLVYVALDMADNVQHRLTLTAAMDGAPDGIALRGASSGADIDQLSVQLGVYEAEHNLEDGATKIISFAGETAQSVLHMAIPTRKSARLTGLIFDPNALMYVLGSSFPGSSSSQRSDKLRPDTIRLARSLTRLTAAAARIPAFEVPFNNADTVDEYCKSAQLEGYSGILTHNPSDIAAINQASGAQPPPFGRTIENISSTIA